MLIQLFMNAIRYWIAVPMFIVAVLFLGFGCATKSEEPKTGAQTTISAPILRPVQLATNAPPPPVATTPPVYVPDMSHANDPLPDGVLAWDELMKATDAAAAQAQAHFTFNLTNISPNNVAIVNVHPSCGCTTAQLPPLPWILAPGTNGQIKITVNLAGKTGTLFKTVKVTTDKGNKTLTLRINILPAAIPNTMTDADRARGLAAAKVDRQAVFRNDCATCHAKPAEGKYGKALYDAVCGVCHEAEHRATMVPDLHALKTPTNEDFWRIWVAHGKPGSLMPAFSTAEGGPLNDMQIASLAAYLNMAIPSKVAPPPQ
jgi:mono/diheme cytochrome c family protein